MEVINDILVAQVLVDPYEGKTPPFEEMFPDQEKDVGQVKDLTDDDLKNLGITISKDKCPVFLYWYNDFKVGEMGSTRFNSDEEVINFFKDVKHTSIGGRRHTINGGVVIRYVQFPDDFNQELSEAAMNLYMAYQKLSKAIDPTYKCDPKTVVNTLIRGIKAHGYA